MVELATLMVETRGEVQLVRLAGEVDFSNAGQLVDEVSELIPNGAAGVVLDLSDTRYLDSAGIRMLFELSERLRGRRQELALVVPQDSLIRHSLIVTEVDQAMQICDTGVEAIDWVRSAQRPE